MLWTKNALRRATSAVAFAVVAAGPAAAQTYTIAALGETSDTYQLAVGWSDALKKSNATVSLTPLGGGGTVKVMRGVAQGTWDIGFVSTPHYLHATGGKGNFAEDPSEMIEKYATVRALFGITSGFGAYVVRADSGIKKITDLKGKKVAVGRPGGGGSKITPALFSAHGVEAETDYQVEFLQPNEGFDEMRNGRLDVVAAWGGIPQAAVYSFSRSTPVRLLSLTKEGFQKFQSEFPGGSSFVLRTFQPEDLKAGYGDGIIVDGPVSFFTFPMQVVIRGDAPEDDVYELVKAFWGNLDTIKKTSAQLSNLNQMDALEGLSAELHSGAARYYREQGWIE